MLLQSQRFSFLRKHTKLFSRSQKYFEGGKRKHNKAKATHDGAGGRSSLHNLLHECKEIDTKDNKALLLSERVLWVLKHSWKNIGV